MLIKPNVCSNEFTCHDIIWSHTIVLLRINLNLVSNSDYTCHNIWKPKLCTMHGLRRYMHTMSKHIGFFISLKWQCMPRIKICHQIRFRFEILYHVMLKYIHNFYIYDYISCFCFINKRIYSHDTYKSTFVYIYF